jgi:hypothetical protein
VSLFLKLMASTFVPTTMRYNLGIYVRTGAAAPHTHASAVTAFLGGMNACARVGSRIGLAVRADTPVSWGGSLNAAGVYGRCVQETLGGRAAGLVDMDGDGCGDLNKTAVDASACVLTQLSNVSCVDLDGDGLVNVPVCMTWSTAPTDCRTVGMIPSSASKCVCTSINLPGLYVYGGPDPGKLVQPNATLPPGAPPVVWPAAATPPPPAAPPPSPPGVPVVCPAGGAVYNASSGVAYQLVNGGFETPADGIPQLVPQAGALGGLPGWHVTATDGMVELVVAKSSLPAGEGVQFAETCASTKCAALYQDVATTPGTQLAWSLLHRGRFGVDTANATLGAPGGGASIVATMVDGTAWRSYGGVYTVPAGQTVTRLSIVPVQAMGPYGTWNAMYGNLVDDVQARARAETCLRTRAHACAMRVNAPC